jgi:membrane protein required for colicin V production
MIWGAVRGITWQVASIASLVLGYAVAFPLSGQISGYFPGTPIVARALALLASYVAVSGGIYLIAWSIRAILREWKFEAYDRHLGMLLGGAEGALLGVVGTVFVISLAPATRHPILTSHAGVVVGQVLNAVQPALPGEVRTMLASFWTGPTAVATNQTDANASDADTNTGSSDKNSTTTSGTPAAQSVESVEKIISEGRERVGRVVAEAVQKEIEGTKDGDGGTVKRR